MNSRPIQLRHGVHFLQREEFHDRQDCYICSVTRNSSKAVSLIINRFDPHLQDDAKTDKSGSSKSIDMQQALDVYVGTAAKHILRTFLNLTHVEPPAVHKKAPITVWPGTDPTERVLFTVVMERILIFVKGYCTLTSAFLMSSCCLHGLCP